MGNKLSSVSDSAGNVTGESEPDVAKINNMASKNEDGEDIEEFHDTIDDHGNQEERTKAKEAEMEEFKRQLQIKREQRREILDRHRSEKKELEESLENEIKAKLEAYENNRLLRKLLIQNDIEIPENIQSSKENIDITERIINMKEEFEKLKANNNKLRRDLVESNSSLQGAYSDIADLQRQNLESMKQINALKEVVSVSKTMLGLRENQLDELKLKLAEIERSLADREANMLSADLRQEYERQLQNIRTLRGLYEERARLAEVTRQSLARDLEEQKALKQAEIDKVKDLTAKVQELEDRVDELEETVTNKNNQLYSCQDETRGLKTEMSAVNKLFSQLLMGYKSPQDLDKLVHRLEENHGILTHMAENENDSEASTALPKLLLEIVSQVDESDEIEKTESAPEGDGAVEENFLKETEAPNSVNTAEEIVQNLPKVWRVLMELLSHQTAPDDNTAEKVTTCYKTVETNSGPVEVPSVSQTYIRLKDLIVEKLALIKEVNRMKQLNTHLETRLEEQERRLCSVTTELSKTWHVVGRLRRHHHQLHTHEKILKYELQQKRKLLNELKEELEYCREKWEQAREKNTQSQKDWNNLRAEFSSRKTKPSISFNNSAESGYSDERPSDDSSESNDESEYVTEPLIRSKKKSKKSFETIVDSSTDRNLAAEREDPASDMLDVADLPLDTQDGDEQHEKSDSCSESLLKSDKICETEDEVCDIAHDSCAEDYLAADYNHASDHLCENKINEETPSSSTISQPHLSQINPAAILKSIREQNERLAKKDKKLEQLERSGTKLLEQSRATAKAGNQLSNTLDHLLNRPTSSRSNDKKTPNLSINTLDSIDEIELKDKDKTQILNTNISNEVTDRDLQDKSVSVNKESQVPIADFKAILEDVRQQNERLVEKDENLQKLERDCVDIINNISESLSNEEELNKKLDVFRSDSPISESRNVIAVENTPLNVPSTSNANVLPAVLEDGVKITEKLDSLHIANSSGESEVLTKEKAQINNFISNEIAMSCTLPTEESNTIQNVKSQTENVEIKEENRSLNNDDFTCGEDIEDQARNMFEAGTSNQEHNSTVSFKDILENVKRQNERLAKKDERLQLLENGCAEVVKSISNTLIAGDEIIEKLDSLHDIDTREDNEIAEIKEGSWNSSSRDSSEPSTSSEIDHEAIFAARDLRFKRLEEQTKSLVNKVNKTTDKGVKIHYKLEELHNIYGSENSRAGTPSDNEEKDRANEEKDNLENECLDDKTEESENLE